MPARRVKESEHFEGDPGRPGEGPHQAFDAAAELT
jgi:hypothetical protein